MTISVYAPASIGNVSVGFDLLGAAVSPVDGTLLGDVVTISGPADNDFSLTLSGPFRGALPPQPQQNLVYQCCHYFRRELLQQRQGVTFVAINLEKNLPVGSGLGSSATSIVATLVALNQYFEQPFSQAQLLTMMGHFEGRVSGSVHYDNVAPCYLGGIQLMNNNSTICQSLPVPPRWYWVLAYSGVNISTKMAREVLPQQLPLRDAIEYARNLALFTDALHRQHWADAANCIRDVVAEPHRRDLLPGFAAATAQLKSMGVLASGISGSGPTLFAVCDSLEQGEKIKTLLNEHYIQNENGFCKICNIDLQGARVLNVAQ